MFKLKGLCGLFLVFIFMAISLPITFAQSSDPERDRTSRPVNGSPPLKNTRRKQLAEKKKTKPVARSGDMEILIDQPGSQIFISNNKGTAIGLEDSLVTGAEGAPVVVRSLASGWYTVRVKKDGFFEETKQFYIRPGQPNQAVISMRSSMGYLTVTTTVSDARIEIDAVGTFQGGLNRYLIKPGSYRIVVSKEGYLSSEQNVEIELAGFEKTVIIPLFLRPK